MLDYRTTSTLTKDFSQKNAFYQIEVDVRDFR